MADESGAAVERPGFSPFGLAAPLAVGVGLVLLALSYLWPLLRPPASGWSDTEAAELSAIEVQVANLKKKIGEARLRGVAIPDRPAPLDRLLDRAADLQLRFNDTLDAPARTARRVRIAAVVALALGVLSHALHRRRPLKPASPSASGAGR